MEQIALAIVSGVVTAVLVIVVLYRRLERSMEAKLKNYGDALLKYQFEQRGQQAREIAGIAGKVERVSEGVGELGRALGNVKTRGIYGEWQLGSILQQLLRPEQYETECMVIPGSTKRVEYAVKMPGKNTTVYLPIDSKFPLDAYLNLQETLEEGSEEDKKDAVDLFKNRVKRFAKEVHDKYIMPPYTTDFAILFFPFEGVYTEVLQLGLVEELMVKYHITVAGPSTLGAILNGLQVGFRSVALDEQTEEVREALAAVKAEVEQFENVLQNLQGRLEQSNAELDKLVGTRIRKLKKKLEYF
ncbi:MAG: DNA recombination protein RmuC [Eubacterium sp.]|nr:DNA recombination protein RmuC [Eubacterium sp.]